MSTNCRWLLTEARISHITLLLLSQYHPHVEVDEGMVATSVSNHLQHDLLSCVQPRSNSTRNVELGGEGSPKHAHMVGELSVQLFYSLTN